MVEFLIDRPVNKQDLSWRRILHLTIYPQLHFPQVARRLNPRLPHKIFALGRIVLAIFVHVGKKEVT